jgi:hypothetical protein
MDCLIKLEYFVPFFDYQPYCLINVDLLLFLETPGSKSREIVLLEVWNKIHLLDSHLKNQKKNYIKVQKIKKIFNKSINTN